MGGEAYLRIATRKSPLAIWQANYVKAQLQAHHPHLEIELIRLVTEGDKQLTRSLAKVGGKGLFIKALEEAIYDGRADLAVHSVKDLPAEIPEDMRFVVVGARADPRDVLITHQSSHSNSIEALAKGSIVGTSSLRRQCQLLHLRPDLKIEPVRGNVGTRLKHLDEGSYSALVLASAGIQRLAESKRIVKYFSPEEMLPAIGQGALCAEYHHENIQVETWLMSLPDLPTTRCIQAERAFNRHLGGDCQTPIAGFAQYVAPNKIQLRGLIGKEDGKLLLKAAVLGDDCFPEQLGDQLAKSLIDQGAFKILNRTG